MTSAPVPALQRLARFAATLERQILDRQILPARVTANPRCTAPGLDEEDAFSAAALELFAAQFEANPVYRRLCLARGITSSHEVRDWRAIPAMPTAAFKEFSVTSLPLEQRAVAFHSSGTTGRSSSVHLHSQASLHLYECSLLGWFGPNVLEAESRMPGAASPSVGNPAEGASAPRLFLSLTPPSADTPHSSLAHMFDVVGRRWAWRTGAPVSAGAWHAMLCCLLTDCRV